MSACSRHTVSNQVMEDSLETQSKSLNSSIIKNLHTSLTNFNPYRNTTVSFNYSLKNDGDVSLQICDEDGFVVRNLLVNSPRDKGSHSEIWDGKDNRGLVVPNEAYFPIITVETKKMSDTINPLLLTGGIELNGHDVNYDSKNQLFTYRLDNAARVIGRAGKKNGVLLKTIVDSEPRLSGTINEVWDGTDDFELQNIFEIKEEITGLLYGYSLPFPFVISFGNSDLTYRDYKREFDNLLTKRFLPDSTYLSKNRISKHYYHPRLHDHSPNVSIKFPQCFEFEKDGTPILSNKTLVKVDIVDHDKQFKMEQYEITFFLDNVFYAEEEVGYTPYNWLWRLGEIEKGYHIFTVNLSSFNDRIGSRSVRIKIE